MPPDSDGKERGSLIVAVGQTPRRRATFVLLLGVLLPAIISFGILYQQALSVPYQDDYGTVLDFAIGYNHLPSFKDKVLDIVGAQSNEYKLIFEHAIVASELELTHRLNFGFLNALGNCFLLAIVCLLWKMYSGTGDLETRLARFLPISLLFFSLTYWENLNWTTTDLQNIPIVLFSLLAIYLLVTAPAYDVPGPPVLAACMSAALAGLTSANGFLLLPVGILFLLPRRAYAVSVVWCASFVVPLLAYLYHYTPQPHQINRFFYLTRPLFFLAFLGGAASFRWVCALLGVVVLIVVFLAIRERFDRTNPAAAYSSMWVLATACLVAWVRGGNHFSMASRYSIYSILLLIGCYLFLAQYLPGRFSGLDQRRFYLASLVFASGLWLVGNVSAYQHLRARRQMVLAGIELYRAAPQVNSPMIDPLVEQTFPMEKKGEQDVLTKSIQEGVFVLPPKQETAH